MTSTALARPRNLLLDTTSAEEIVNSERTTYLSEVRGMQREKRTLLRGQPWNNAALLLANVIMAGLFFYVTSLNAGSVLPPDAWWAQPLVGLVSAGGASCLMYATNAIAYKLPSIKDRKSLAMMWPVWICCLIVSGITSAFIALLLVNGADSKMDAARMTMAQAERIAGVESAAVSRAQGELDQWMATAAQARTQRAAAVERRSAAEARLAAWREATLAEFGQGSAAANRRMAPTHPEHAPLIAAIGTAQADVETFDREIGLAERRIEETRAGLASARADMRGALDAHRSALVSDQSPWEETMEDMASLFRIVNIHFESGGQFKAAFAVFFALVLTLAPPFWSYQTGASVAPEVEAQAKRMAEIDENAAEARRSLNGGGGAPKIGAGFVAAGDGSAGMGGPAPVSETASMGAVVDAALGLADPDPALPCGLSQSRFDKLYRLNYDKVQRLMQDAEGRLLDRAGEIALKRRYGGNEDVAKMLKHVLVIENYGEYSPDGSVNLYNPASGGA